MDGVDMGVAGMEVVFASEVDGVGPFDFELVEEKSVFVRPSPPTTVSPFEKSDTSV